MSNPKTVEIVLVGAVIPKKNNRINLKSGVSIPNNKFTQWQDDAITEVRKQTRHRFYNPVSLELIIYFGTKRKADLDNRLTSIMDMLAEALIVRDDKWEDIPLIQIQAEYRKNKPGAFIRLTELI